MKPIANILLLLLVPIISSAQIAPTVKYKEPFRPQFHFTPESKWMNDPNGLIFYNGKYHLFYQYYPKDIVWGPMHWGHASSPDLFHWQHNPIALYPDTNGGIFSGCAVIDVNNTAGFGKNAMVAIFTYHSDSAWIHGYSNTESQALAYSLDEGITWTKYTGNPVLPNSCEKDFRDPNVFWNEDIHQWNMVLAVGDRVKIFTSENLKEWKFKSDFKPSPDLEKTGTWECVDLFRMQTGTEQKWVMIVNHDKYAPNGGSGTRYFIGDFNGEVFTHTQPSRWLDYGTDFYAGVTFHNVPQNKRLLIAWMSNWMYANKTPTKEWRGAMTLPRELKLDKDENGYFLRQQITGGFENNLVALKRKDTPILPYHDKSIDLSQTEIKLNVNGDAFEIKIANKNNEQVLIQWINQQLIVNRSQSGITNFSDKFTSAVQTMQVAEPIKNCQIILDKMSMEILINNGKYSMTIIYFPTQPYSEISIDSKNKTCISSLEFNRIKGIW